MIQRLEKCLTLPSPVQELTRYSKRFSDIQLFIKRDDLIHPLICGNKWRKLKYNLHEFVRDDYESILSFGGAYSNHLVAIAAAGELLEVATIGIIRSYHKEVNNPTIELLRQKGMKVFFVHPDEYKQKERSLIIRSIIAQFDNAYVIEEGGTNLLAMKGVGEMMEEVIGDAKDFSHVVLALGTGGTLAGVAQALKGTGKQIVAISPFKGGIKELEGFKYIDEPSFKNIDIIPCFPQSRFGAYDVSIVDYIRSFNDCDNILLDPVYTVKVLMTTEHLINQGYFPLGSQILLIHTGGLQGIAGYEYQNNCQILSE